MDRITEAMTYIERTEKAAQQQGYKCVLESATEIVFFKENWPCFSDSGFYNGGMLGFSHAQQVILSTMNGRKKVRYQGKDTEEDTA